MVAYLRSLVFGSAAKAPPSAPAPQAPPPPPAGAARPGPASLPPGWPPLRRVRTGDDAPAPAPVRKVRQRRAQP